MLKTEYIAIVCCYISINYIVDHSNNRPDSKTNEMHSCSSGIEIITYQRIRANNRHSIVSFKTNVEKPGGP